MNSKDMDIDDSEDKQEVTEENKQQIGEEAKEEIQEEVKEQLIMNVSGSTIGKINNQLNELDFDSNISSLSFDGQSRIVREVNFGEFPVGARMNEAGEVEPIYANILGAKIEPGDGAQGKSPR
jgi:predicted ATP-dependent protease